MAHTLSDTEFGAVRVKRAHSAQYVRLRITAEGALVATLPKRAPLRLVKELIEDSREELRKIVVSTKQTQQKVYADKDRVGASHTLRFLKAVVDEPKLVLRNQIIEITLPFELDTEALLAQVMAKKGIVKALKKEAAAYLPRRLSHLAEKYGFSYSSIRYTNAKGRWGSCSTSGTISLNIALMNLPMDIIDYILVHELCHTKQMNHSSDFWDMVEGICPDYRILRASLKSYTPYL